MLTCTRARRCWLQIANGGWRCSLKMALLAAAVVAACVPMRSMLKPRLRSDEVESPEVPDWPDAACKLPPQAGWALARDENGGIFNMAVLVTRDYLPGHSDMSDSVRRKGHYETRGPSGFNLKRRGVLVDVGANIGDYSFYFARAGWRALAVEPMPLNVALMNATLCANPALRGRVRIVHAALGSLSDKGKLCTVCGMSNAQVKSCSLPSEEGEPCDAGDQEARVPMRTLEDIVEASGLGNVDALKVDVEGHECKVLEGFPQLAKRHSATFALFETTSQRTTACVERFAREGGYRFLDPWPGNEAKLTRNTP